MDLTRRAFLKKTKLLGLMPMTNVFDNYATLIGDPLWVDNLPAHENPTGFNPDGLKLSFMCDEPDKKAFKRAFAYLPQYCKTNDSNASLVTSELDKSLNTIELLQQVEENSIQFAVVSNSNFSEIIPQAGLLEVQGGTADGAAKVKPFIDQYLSSRDLVAVPFFTRKGFSGLFLSKDVCESSFSSELQVALPSDHWYFSGKANLFERPPIPVSSVEEVIALFRDKKIDLTSLLPHFVNLQIADQIEGYYGQLDWYDVSREFYIVLNKKNKVSTQWMENNYAQMLNFGHRLVHSFQSVNEQSLSKLRSKMPLASEESISQLKNIYLQVHRKIVNSSSDHPLEQMHT